jgi:hypothetical protein
MRKNKIKRKEGLAKKPKAAAEPVLSEKDLPEAAPCAVADGGDDTHKIIQPSPANPNKRKCECCGAALATYNTDNLCWPCDKAIAEWMNFPMNRSEIERSMSSHTLKYVSEKLTGRKRASNAVGGEISSGSWARATGRKQIERK